MASVEKRVRGGKTAYVARWRDGDGKARSKSFPRKVDAERHGATVQAAIARGNYIDDSATITVTEYARQWFDAQHYRRTTRGYKETFLRQRLEADPLGAMRLVKVSQKDIRAWAARQVNQEGGDGRKLTNGGRRAGGLGPLTLLIQVGYLRSVFRAAMLEEPPLRATNPVPPANRLSLPKVDKPKYVPLTVAQVRQLADEVAETAPHLRAAVLTQAGLGLRLGELLALRRQDVDFLRRVVHVADQLELHTLRRVPPKTPKSRRDIPLPGWLALVLSAHMQDYPPGRTGLLFTINARKSWLPSGAQGPPRRKWDSEAIDHTGMGKTIRLAVKRAGLPAGTSSHDLRHHYASMLIAQGQSVYAVAEMLGHADAALVLSTYGHLMPGSEDTIRKAIETAWDEPAGEDRDSHAL